MSIIIGLKSKGVTWRKGTKKSVKCHRPTRLFNVKKCKFTTSPQKPAQKPNYVQEGTEFSPKIFISLHYSRPLLRDSKSFLLSSEVNQCVLNFIYIYFVVSFFLPTFAA